MQVSKLLRFLNQQFQNHVLGFTEVMRLVSQRQTTILSIRLTVSQDLFLKHKSDHPTTKDEDDAQKGEEPKDETQPSESKEETAVSKETAQTTALNHAGLAEGSVTNLKTELKTEGDGKVYNISFDLCY